MAVPTLTVRADWDNTGTFPDTINPERVTRSRGASADYSGEAIGEMTLVFDSPQLAAVAAAGKLVPGKPVHAYATYSGTDYPLFYGAIERVTTDPESSYITLTCYDPLRRLSEVDVVVPPSAYFTRTARDFRLAVLEDFERGTLNLLPNGSFETNTTSWATTGTSLTRVATDAAPGAGSAYGAFVASATDQVAYTHPRMASVLFEGQVYRFSAYLKLDSGASWKIGIGTSTTDPALHSEISVTVTSTWTRFTVTYELPATTPQTAAVPVQVWVKSTAAGTVRIDAAAVTRGQALYPYADVGTGRWPNMVGVNNFDGGTTSGWFSGFTNLLGNGSFETNTAGWSVAGDAFTNAATSITRTSGTAKFGSWHGLIQCAGGAGSGAFNAITGTFTGGVSHYFAIWVQGVAPITQTVTVGIGSQGTPADLATFAATANNGAYTLYEGFWTPSSTRTDAHLFVKTSAGSGPQIRIDGGFVIRATGGPDEPQFSDTGPGGGGVAVTTITTSTTAKFGARSLSVATPATANAGVLYDFNNYGSYFVGGRQYVKSIWIRPTSDMPYKVGLAGNKGDGTWDEATAATGTALANVWTQITPTWTPSADRSSAAAFDTVQYVYQTDATARTVLIDGARTIPGGTADDFEMAQWDLDANASGEAGDQYLATASLSGSALSALKTLNRLTLTRHWIRPTMAAPWYTYVTEDRVTYAAKSVVETFSGTANGFNDQALDRSEIRNIIPVLWAGGGDYYSDSDSVGTYGPRLGSRIDGTDFFPDRTIPDLIGPALVTRYRSSRERPALRLENNFPAQLARELNDVIAVTIARFGLSAEPYLILRADLAIADGAKSWVTIYRLEAY